MSEPPSVFEDVFYVAWNYASRLTNIKNKTPFKTKTPGVSRAFHLGEFCAVAKEIESAATEPSLGACAAHAV